MSHVLTRQDVAISNDGELVIMKIGNWSRKLEHDVALKLSAWMRLEAIRAKRLANDHRRSWTVIGILEDANAKPQQVRTRTNHIELLKGVGIRVAINGTLITVTIGKQAMDLTYEGALKISSILRVHGKRAARAAGVTAKWHKIGNVEAIVHSESPFAGRQH